MRRHSARPASAGPPAEAGTTAKRKAGRLPGPNPIAGAQQRAEGGRSLRYEAPVHIHICLGECTLAANASELWRVPTGTLSYGKLVGGVVVLLLHCREPLRAG